jgi:hypothetical protein
VPDDDEDKDLSKRKTLTMRFLITIGPCENDATKNAGANAKVDDKNFADMMAYNEEMTRAGVLVTAEGLLPGGIKKRVIVSGAQRTVVDGPFAETKEVLGGFYVLEVDSEEEAIGWVKRFPAKSGHDRTVEVRQLTSLSDLQPEFQKRIAEVAPKWSASLWRTREPAAKSSTAPARATRS